MKTLLVAAVAGALWAVSLSGQAPAESPRKASIIRVDPSFDEIVPAGAKLELLKEGFKDGLEGGVWIRSGNYLLFSNKPQQTVDKWTADGKHSVYLDLGKLTGKKGAEWTLSSGTTLDKEGRLVYTSPGEQAIVRIEKDGQRTMIATHYNGKRLVHPNDLVYKSNGTLYFTDNAAPPPGVTQELPFSVYMLRNGKVELLSTGVIERPNGIALSPDEKVLYVNNSTGKQVFRFDIQPDETLANGKLWVDLSKDQRPGVPDGMRVDQKGNVYDSGPGGIYVFAPSGKHLGTFELPDRGTNMAFGDADGKTLYLVNHTSLYKIKLKIPGLIH
jgi:gluconolactonase